jgi:ferredoxin-thioredoxin reductase catalytic subunit
MDDTESKIYAWAKEYAQDNGLKLNPDYDIVVLAIKGLCPEQK